MDQSTLIWTLDFYRYVKQRAPRLLHRFMGRIVFVPDRDGFPHPHLQHLDNPGLAPADAAAMRQLFKSYCALHPC